MYHMILGNMVKRLKMYILGPKGYKETQQKVEFRSCFKKLAEDHGKQKKKNRSRLLLILTWGILAHQIRSTVEDLQYNPL